MHSTASLGLGSAALDTTRLRAVQVAGGDPALIVGLGARRDSRTVSADNGNLVSRVDGLGALRRSLGALATLATALLLREQSRDPSVVDEVAGAGENGSENEVEEKAASR